jgi:hypothetical protein
VALPLLSELFLSFLLVLSYVMSFQLSNVWQVLGPFPIGMREQDFGADPLEAYGKRQW